MFGEVKKSCIFETSNKQKHTNTHIMANVNTTPANGYHLTWSQAQYMANVTKLTDRREPLFSESWDVPSREDIMRMAYYDPCEFEKVMQLVMDHADKPIQVRAIKAQMRMAKQRGIEATK